MEALTVWMIIGFLLSAYAVIGNDSVQTLGTFIASNRKVKWQYLWLFTSLILVMSLAYSYVTYGGDIAHGRLEKIPFVNIEWYHAFAPLVLVILTRIGIPVSTSLLVLSAFASSLVFEQILSKSAIGYVLAAVSAYTLWMFISSWDNKRHDIKSEHESRWRTLQWCATGFLWFTWLSHEIAIIVVFLPRTMDLTMLTLVTLVFVGALAYIFWNKGGKIQEIVLEKTATSYVRSATIIDLLFAFVLLFFKEFNSIPMSTTWVFIGLLAGRELAIATRATDYNFKDVFPLVGKDIFKLLFGLAISIVIALGIQNRSTIAAFVGF
jgi:hypothetical protein